jgi:hypothetical protein
MINDIVIQSVCFGTSCQKSAKLIVNRLNKEIPAMDTKKVIVNKTSITNILEFLTEIYINVYSGLKSKNHSALIMIKQ